MRTVASEQQNAPSTVWFATPFALTALLLMFLAVFSALLMPNDLWLVVAGIGPIAAVCIAAAYFIANRLHGRRYAALEAKNANMAIELKILTEQIRAMEDELVHSKESLVLTEKMASLGQLSAGVAHEINNPVGFMMSNMCTLKEYIFFLDQLCKQLLELMSQLSKQEKLNHEEIIQKIESTLKIEDLDFVLSDANTLIDESLSGGSRIKDITNGMKGYVRESKEEQDVLVNDLIEQTLSIVWNQIKYNCTLEKHLTSSEKVRIVPSSLNQVLLNIMVNASHAMDGMQGTLTIRTYESEKNVFIEISDTGCGIDDEHLSKIFDPFFTTKPVGQGTGLGMSISYEIITAAGGNIDVSSEIGKGTCFKIRLPAVQKS